MSYKKGFTLIEIIVVLVIIATLAAIAMPNYYTMMQQGAAKAAQNNLITIYNGQKNYYLSLICHGSYCVSPICGSLNGGAVPINFMLRLNIIDNSFNYRCVIGAIADNGFKCTATGINSFDPSLILTVTNNPIVLPGGTGCATNAGASCNPSCATDIPAYCPS